MARQIPWSLIGTERERRPDNLDTGVYHCRVENLSETETTTGKLTFLVRSRVVAPASYKGMSLFDRFYIGTNEDPQAQGDAWKKSWGAEQFKDFVTVCNIEPDSDFEVLGAQLNGKEFLASVEVGLDDGVRKNQDGSTYTRQESVGRRRQDVRERLKFGTREVGVINGGLEQPQTTRVETQIPPRAVDEDEGFVLEETE